MTTNHVWQKDDERKEVTCMFGKSFAENFSYYRP